MATLIGLYAITGNIMFVVLVAVDFYLRASTRRQASPGSWVAARIERRLGLPTRQIDRAPKIFAARVGVLLLLATLGLYFINPSSSIVAALVLMGFALLEAMLGFCVGCHVYTYFVLPWFSTKA